MVCIFRPVIEHEAWHLGSKKLDCAVVQMNAITHHSTIVMRTKGHIEPAVCRGLNLRSRVFVICTERPEFNEAEQLYLLSLESSKANRCMFDEA